MEELGKAVEEFVFKCLPKTGGCGHEVPHKGERWPLRPCPECRHSMRLVHAEHGHAVGDA